MTEEQFAAIRVLQDSGYVVVARDRIRSLHVSSSLDDTLLTTVEVKDMKGIIHSDMAHQMAHSLLDSKFVRIVEHEPNHTDGWPRRLFRMDLSILLPRVFT